VPHAFQHKLSYEKTPILCEALPSFQKIIVKWEEYQDKMPEYAYHIEAGLLKLQDYFPCAMKVPVYQLAICKMVLSLIWVDWLIIFIVSPSTSSIKEAFLVP